MKKLTNSKMYDFNSCNKYEMKEFIKRLNLNQYNEFISVIKKRYTKFINIYKVDRKAEEKTHFMCMDKVALMNGYDNKGSSR